VNWYIEWPKLQGSKAEMSQGQAFIPRALGTIITSIEVLRLKSKHRPITRNQTIINATCAIQLPGIAAAFLLVHSKQPRTLGKSTWCTAAKNTGFLLFLFRHTAIRSSTQVLFEKHGLVVQ
jgi:hypothetical protein